MTLRNADRDSARIAAIDSLGAVPLAEPRVEAVDVSGTHARVRLVGGNGLHAIVELLKEEGHWRVTGVRAA